MQQKFDKTYITVKKVNSERRKLELRNKINTVRGFIEFFEKEIDAKGATAICMNNNVFESLLFSDCSVASVRGDSESFVFVFGIPVISSEEMENTEVMVICGDNSSVFEILCDKE